MKHKMLRKCLKDAQTEQKYVLQDCKLVIDGKSFFSDTYKNSGCQYIYGTECDRYASYLKNVFDCFIQSKVNCYVIINGGMFADVDTRKDVLNKIVEARNSITPQNVGKNHYDPVFVKDVLKEVLDELGVKYMFCEYDSKETVINVAKHFKCPVLTKNIQYSLYGVSCIEPSSLSFDKDSGEISCNIHLREKCRQTISLKEEMLSTFLILLDEDREHFDLLPSLPGLKCRKNRMVRPVIFWIIRNKYDYMKQILRSLPDEKARQAFKYFCTEERKLLNFKPSNFYAINYFANNSTADLLSMGHGGFQNCVNNGIIAVPYVNLKNNQVFTGSWMISDERKSDALLPAMDIVAYVHCLLNASEKSDITFIGRKRGETCVWNIETVCPVKQIERFSKPLKTSKRSFAAKAVSDKCNPLYCFLTESMPDIDLNLLNTLQRESWMLIISLVYYMKKVNKEFLNGAYCALLSFVMLNEVGSVLGVIKRSNLLNDGTSKTNSCEGSNLSYKNCVTVASTLIDLFYLQNLESNFDRAIIHTFAEFYHCLQHMNYLNKMCGEMYKCTVYHKAINATFMYNIFVLIKDKEDPKEFLIGLLGKTVSPIFTNLVNVLENLVWSVGM